MIEKDDARARQGSTGHHVRDVLRLSLTAGAVLLAIGVLIVVFWSNAKERETIPIDEPAPRSGLPDGGRA